RQGLLRRHHEVDRAGRVRVEAKERCVQPAACPRSLEPGYHGAFDRLVVDPGRSLKLAKLAKSDAETYQALDSFRIVFGEELRRPRQQPFRGSHVRPTKRTASRRRQQASGAYPEGVAGDSQLRAVAVRLLEVVPEDLLVADLPAAGLLLQPVRILLVHLAPR